MCSLDFASKRPSAISPASPTCVGTADWDMMMGEQSSSSRIAKKRARSLPTPPALKSVSFCSEKPSIHLIDSCVEWNGSDRRSRWYSSRDMDCMARLRQEAALRILLIGPDETSTEQDVLGLEDLLIEDDSDSEATMNSDYAQLQACIRALELRKELLLDLSFE